MLLTKFLLSPFHFVQMPKRLGCHGSLFLDMSKYCINSSETGHPGRDNEELERERPRLVKEVLEEELVFWPEGGTRYGQLLDEGQKVVIIDVLCRLIWLSFLHVLFFIGPASNVAH